MPKRLMLRAVVLLSFAFWCLSSQAKPIAVVVEKSNAVSDITSADLVKILTFVTAEWQDGHKVQIVLRDPSSPEIQQALQAILRLPEDKLKALLAAHKDSFQVAKTDEELLKIVAANPGAIGLVNVYSINNKVAVLKVDRKLPLEQGYLFH